MKADTKALMLEAQCEMNKYSLEDARGSFKSRVAAKLSEIRTLSKQLQKAKADLLAMEFVPPEEISEIS